MIEAEPKSTDQKTIGHYARVQLVILLAFLALTVFPTYFLLMRPNAQAKARDAAFSQIEKGMSEAAVVKLMGAPSEVTSAPTALLWEHDPLDAATAARVKREYRYALVSFFLPVSWTIGFDANGNAIAKHQSE